MDPASEPFLRAKEEDDREDAEVASGSIVQSSAPNRSLRWAVAAHLGLMVLYGVISWICVQVYLNRYMAQHSEFARAVHSRLSGY
jgi:hypothetical protein